MRRQSENLLLLTDPTRRPDFKYRLNPIFSAPINGIYRCSSATDREKTFENIIRKYILDSKRKKLKKAKKSSLSEPEQSTSTPQQPNQVVQNGAEPEKIKKMTGKRRRFKGTPKKPLTAAQKLGKIVGGISNEMIEQHKKDTKLINEIITNGSANKDELINMVNENINKVQQNGVENINAV